MAFPSTVIKAQLPNETEEKEDLLKDRAFIEYAQDMVGTSPRNEEARNTTEEDTGWNRVTEDLQKI